MRKRPLIALHVAFSLASAGDSYAAQCRITYPPENSLLRGIVPVFGVANCPDFKCYRVEYGAGLKPAKWRLVRLGQTPQREDPFALGKVKWDPNRGAKGTLANWDTGLTAYRYGQKFEANLNGVYTLRLLVVDKKGRKWEDRISVEVGRVVTNIDGGDPLSPDGVVRLRVPAWASPSEFLVVSIQPSTDVRPGPGLMPLSKVYEVRPPKREFVHPCKLTFHCPRTAFKNGLEPRRVAIYEYQPVEEAWKALSTQIDPEGKQAVAYIKRLTPYLSYFALFADVHAPGPPEFTRVQFAGGAARVTRMGKSVAACETVSRREVTIQGRSEPFARITVHHMGPKDEPFGVYVSSADVDGLFSFDVLLAQGRNRFEARAEDGGANEGAPSTLDMPFAWRHPKSVKSLRLLGPSTARRGSRYLVVAAGKDTSPDVDATAVRVRTTKADPEGILLELVETASNTGVFVGELTVGDRSDPKAGVIAAKTDGEEIEACWVVEKNVRTGVEYCDKTPPAAPRVASPTHPSFCQLTFEPSEDPMGAWMGRDGVFGAAVRIEREAGNSYIVCQAQKAPTAVHLGSGMNVDGLDLAKFPILEFDYRIKPMLQINLCCRLKSAPGGWKEIVLSQPQTSFDKIGQVFGASADGLWHTGHANLLAMVRACCPGRKSCLVGELAFMTLRGGVFMRRGFRAPPGAYDAYALDNIRLVKYASARDATFEFTSSDDNGIAAFSFMLDQRPNTAPDTAPDRAKRLPPKEGQPPTWLKSYEKLEDGRWYFHVRAQDRAGNWGPANHYAIVVDTQPPKLRVLSDLKKPVAWNESITFGLSDAVGIDPFSIRLTISGRRFDVNGRALAFDDRTGDLVFTPSKGQGEDKIMFAHRERVRVRLTARDLAGRPAKPLTCVFVAASPLHITPSNSPGLSGWYKAMPKVSLQPPEDMTGKLFIEEEAAGAAEHRRRARIFRIIAALAPKYPKTGAGAAYYKRIIIYAGALGARASIDPPQPDLPAAAYSKPPTIRFVQSPRVLSAGGMNAAFFRNANFSEPIEERIDGPINFGPASRSANHAPGRCQSARWVGWIKVDKTQTYELEAVTASNPTHKAAANLWIDGEQVLDAHKRKFVWSVKNKVLLTKGYHRIRLEYSEPGGRAWWLQLFWWRPDRDWRELIPAENLLALRSVATIYYRWDSKGKWQAYKKPLTAPAGKHTVYYFARDEAGHVEKAKTLEVNVAGKKAQDAARDKAPAGAAQAQGAEK